EPRRRPRRGRLELRARAQGDDLPRGHGRLRRGQRGLRAALPEGATRAQLRGGRRAPAWRRGRDRGDRDTSGLTHSAPLEGRGALLEKGAHAFLLVRGLEETGERRRLDRVRVGEQPLLAV